jgi:hypothetical protein
LDIVILPIFNVGCQSCIDPVDVAHAGAESTCRAIHENRAENVTALSMVARPARAAQLGQRMSLVVTLTATCLGVER